MMDNHFTEIADLESLDRFVANLNGSAGVVFKHSDTCGVSARAYTEMSKLELLMIKDGKVVWNASHFQVKAEAVEAALREVSSKQRAVTSKIAWQ